MTLLELKNTTQTCPNLLSNIVTVDKDDIEHKYFRFIYESDKTSLKITE